MASKKYMTAYKERINMEQWEKGIIFMFFSTGL